MLRHLSKTYGIPISTLVCISLAGVLTFCAVVGILTFQNLVGHWPGMPVTLAVVLSVLAPVVLLLSVGVIGAAHDKMASLHKPSQRTTSQADSTKQPR